MKKTKIAKLLSVIVMLAGIMIMVGWIFNIEVLKNIIPGWITMKFTTAVCFVLSGITIYFIARSEEAQSGFAPVVLPITSLIILLFMVSFLASFFLRMRLGMEELFIKETHQITAKDWILGRPSVATMMEFTIIAIAGILTMLNVTNLKSKLLFLGWVITVIGGAAVIGYLINAPFLRYDIIGMILKDGVTPWQSIRLFCL